MEHGVFYIAGISPAAQFAGKALAARGCTVAAVPSPQVTHVLLDVPSKIGLLPPDLGDGVVVFGGFLPPLRQKTFDLLLDEAYLAENAVITAHCALKLLLQRLECTLVGEKILLVGWGRISKALAPLLRSLGATVTIATRSAKERAMLQALDYGCMDSSRLVTFDFRIIINTAPAPVLQGQQPGQLWMDLASVAGMQGEEVYWDRGLPGKEAPETSGALIGRTVLRLAFGKEQL